MSEARERFSRVDFQGMVNRYSALRTFYGVFDSLGAPSVYVRWGTSPKAYGISGCCTYVPKVDAGLPYVPPATRPEITLTLGTNAKPAHIVQALLHELSHAAGWPKHDNCFYNTLREAVREAHGVDCDRMQWTRVYEYDEWQLDALEEAFGTDESALLLLPEGIEPVPGRRSRSLSPSVFDYPLE